MPNKEAESNYEVSILVRKHETADGRTFYGATARVCDVKSADFAGSDPMFSELLDRATDESQEAFELALKNRFRFKVTMKSGATLPTSEGIYAAKFKGSCWIDKRPSVTHPTIWANPEPATWSATKIKDAPPLASREDKGKKRLDSLSAEELETIADDGDVAIG